jgi:NTP pyrophosphatase (non-canonical NTP hydrolase)
MSFTFTDYQEIAKSTAVYPNIGKNPYYPALGLAGEAGEVADKVKKIMRDHNGEITEDMREKIVKEIGDVLWYVAAMCWELGVNLEDVAQGNNKKLLDRQERNALSGSGDER